MPRRTWHDVVGVALAIVLAADLAAGQSPSPVAAVPPGVAARAAAAAPASNPQSADVPFFPGRSRIVVCTGERIPVVICEGREPADYRGFEIDLFRAVMPSLGWNESMLDWRCLDRAQLRAQLVANGSSSGGGGSGSGHPCDIVVAGLPVSSVQLSQGASFSYPTSGDSYGLLVKAQRAPNETWRFLDAFSWQLWVSIPLTCIAIGCIVWALDKVAFWGHRKAALNEPKSPLAPPTISAGTLNEKCWEGLGRPMGIQPPLARGVGGRVVWLTFGFVIMVLVTLYTSVTAATITVAQLRPGIQTKDDLFGKTVGVSRFYNGTLPPRVTAVRYGSDDAMLDALLREAVDVVILPNSFLLHTAVFDCRMEIVGESFNAYDRAIVLPPAVRNDPLIAAINTAVLELHYKGEDGRIARRYYPPRDQDVCPAYQQTTHITLHQVSGLWVVLAIGVVVAFLLASWPLAAAWWARRRQAAAQQGAAEPAPSKAGGPLLPLSRAGSGKAGAAAAGHAGAAVASAQPPAAQLPQDQQDAAGQAGEGTEQRLEALLQAQEELLQEISGALQQEQEAQQARALAQQLFLQGPPAAAAALSPAVSRRVTLAGMLLLLLQFAGSAAGQQVGAEQVLPAPRPAQSPLPQPVAAAVAAAAAAAVPPASAPQTTDIPFFPGRTRINICTAEQTPMAYCVDRVPLNFTGYQVEVFNALLPALGWTYPMLNWSCLPWRDVVDSLRAGDGSCDIAVALMPVDHALQREGLTFTWPTIRATMMGYLSMVNGRAFDRWSFLDAFTWQLWLALWGTAACVGLLVWLFDVYSLWANKYLAATEDAAQPKPAPRLLTAVQWKTERPLAEHYTYASLGRFMRICIWKTRSDPARIVVLCYAFLQLTLSLIYVANTTASVTAFSLTTAASELSQLKRVGTWEALRGRVPDADQAEITYFPWNSMADETAMLDALKSGEVQALWMPKVFLDYVASFDCSVAVVADPWIPGLSMQLRIPTVFDVAFAYPRGFNSTALQWTINAALLALKESDLITFLQSEQLTRPSYCNRNSLPRQAAQLGFQQVAGLWVLLAIAVGTGALLAALPHVTYAAARMWAARRAKRAAAGSTGGAGKPGGSSDGEEGPQFKSSSSLKLATSSNGGSHAELLARPPQPVSQRQLQAATVAAAAQQAAPGPAPAGGSAAVEAAAAEMQQQQEEERLAALLDAQQAVERAVSMLRRRR